MNVNLFKDCEIAMESPLIEARRRFVSDSTVAVEIRLKPGGEIPEHGTPESVFFYILEGTGLLSIAGESAQVVPGMVSRCDADVPKSISNHSDALLRVLIVKMS
ncbi:MAG: cupin domain-containing protein [Spirochaetaceae bacterium]|nr:cupin domain-containing protein [Spirochaetaceae bacterium]